MGRKKIKIILGGGLGNQLFQYAAYLYTKQRHPNADTKLSMWQYRIDAYHNGIEIQKIFNTGFNSNMDAINASYNSYKRFSALRKYIILFNAAINKLCGYKIYYDKQIHTPELFDAMVATRYKVLMAGFYQNPRFTDAVKDILFSQYSYKLNDKNEQFIREMRSKTLVSIHIRRGDYLNIPAYNVFNGLAYYHRAIDYILSVFPNAHFVFFSNDIHWVRENFSSIQASFIDWNTKDESYQDLLLMSKCQHNIVANSSFSWWGAYLNSNPDAIKIAPKIWFKDVESKNVVPESWILLDN